MYDLDHAFRPELALAIREFFGVPSGRPIWVACANGSRQEDAIEMQLWIPNVPEDDEVSVFVQFNDDGSFQIS